MDHNKRPANSLLAWYALFVLTTASFVSFVDRNVLLLLSEPIKKALILNDTQVGLLQGTGIALFTAAASYPIGWLADRFDRRVILAGCIALWSAAVVACGLSQNFTQLIIASGLVAFGEAGLGPITFALIPVLFIGAQRQFANSVFAVTAIGGGALALFVAGQLIEAAPTLAPMIPGIPDDLVDWRVSFLLAALPAPFLIALVLSIRLPKKTEPAATVDASALQSLSAKPKLGMLEYLTAQRKTFICWYLGCAFSGISFGAIGPWLAIASSRLYGETPAQVGAAMGTAQIFSAASGFALSLLIFRLFRNRFGSGLPSKGMILANLCMMVCCLALPFVSSATGLAVFFAIFGVFLSLAIMFQPTGLQSLMPLQLMGRGVSIQSVATMILAALPGPLVGMISDRLSAHHNGLMIAMMSVALTVLAIGTTLLWICDRYYFAATEAAAREINTD